jgi:hypothetical protein
MKRGDYIIAFIVVLIFIPFFLSDRLYELFVLNSKAHPLVMSFIKFSLLASIGELIGTRIKTGSYNLRNYGLLPRMIVWGFLGVTIAIAFSIFSHGTPQSLDVFTGKNYSMAMSGSLSWMKFAAAFATSIAMNLSFAPVMMIVHKITDIHIEMNHGKTISILKPVKVKEIFGMINWETQWNFVFKKTIPLFWIPAHTITFLLPGHFRILFAAVLGIILGVILAYASVSENNSSIKPKLNNIKN